jgi:AcrR family transcriptional regulator
MAANDTQAKQRILTATMGLLQEMENVEDITVRQLAERAQVGIGSINYHFRSKDVLLNEAVGQLMGDQAARWYQTMNGSDMGAAERLKMLLKDTASIAFRYPKLSRISISHAMLQGNMEPEQLILPLLRAIFGKSKDELEIRLIAFQLIIATQMIFLRADAFRLYAGVNIFDEEQRNNMIELLVDNLVDQ